MHLNVNVTYDSIVTKKELHFLLCIFLNDRYQPLDIKYLTISHVPVHTENIFLHMGPVVVIILCLTQNLNLITKTFFGMYGILLLFHFKSNVADTSS